MQYSVIIFDTAPTGHTLRFLSFPTVLEKALAKVSTLSGRFGPMFQQVRRTQLSWMQTLDIIIYLRLYFQQMSGMMGMNANQDDMFSKLEEMRSVITEVNNQFKDPVSVFFPMAHSLLEWIPLNSHKWNAIEHHHFCLRLHLRVLVSLWNWENDSGIDLLQNWHSQYRCQPVAFPEERYILTVAFYIMLCKGYYLIVFYVQ